MSGHEGPVRSLLRGKAEPLAARVSTDPLGNLLAFGPAGRSGLRVLLAAHMDEIGIMARKFDDAGFVRFSCLGSILPQVLLGQRVRFASGVTGVIGTESLDDMKELRLSHLFLDVGASSRKEALDLVGHGDTAAFATALASRGRQVVAKALDDRVGCAVLIQCLERVFAGEPEHEVLAAFTSQEEVGVRGAQVAAQAWQPDFAVVIDITPAGDTPKGLDYEVKLGQGPTIKLLDTIPQTMAGFVAPPGVTRFLKEVAGRRGIAWQPDILERGSTDAAAVHITGKGVLTAVISIPTRYAHTPQAVCDLGDVEAARDLVLAVLEELTPAAVGEMLR
ncbi:MAG TPA: M20/M25/M40 family metallo-hydrolase [Bacillota bacterium]|nr:M20/M25/M40 family metallo-hydrolase [Bacillota bacterium]